LRETKEYRGAGLIETRRLGLPGCRSIVPGADLWARQGSSTRQASDSNIVPTLLIVLAIQYVPALLRPSAIESRAALEVVEALL